MILLSISLFVLQKISRAVSKEIVFYLRERLHPLHVQVGEFNASFGMQWKEENCWVTVFKQLK